MRVALIPIAGQIDTTLAFINQKCIPVQGQNLTLEDSKNCGTLADVSRTLQTLRGAIGTVEVAGEHFDKNEATFYDQEGKLFDKADSTITHFDAIISSKNLSDAMQNTATMTDHLNGVSELFERKLGDLFYPPPCTGKLCGLKRVGEVVKALGVLPEPVYYLWEIWKDAH
jgi:hypothetical protein